jgi:hypothetical protein
MVSNLPAIIAKDYLREELSGFKEGEAYEDTNQIYESFDDLGVTPRACRYLCDLE